MRFLLLDIQIRMKFWIRQCTSVEWRMIFFLTNKIWLWNEVPWRGPKNHELLHTHPEMSREMKEEFFLIPRQKKTWPFSRVGRSRIEKNVFLFLISSNKFHLSIWEKKWICFCKYQHFRTEFFRVCFRYVHRLQFVKVCNQYVIFQIHSAYKAHAMFCKLMDSWLVLRNFWAILNQKTERNDSFLKKFAKISFERNFSHLTKDFEHFADRVNILWNLPLQFSSRPDCKNTTEVLFQIAYCWFSNPISFWTVWCRRAMIPRTISTNCEKFWGIVSISPQELFQSFLCLLWSFCFARVWLDPLGRQVLQHDRMSMFVSISTYVTQNFLIYCYQVTKIYCTKSGSVITFSAQDPCNFGSLTNFAISVVKKKNVSFQILAPRKRGLQR